ncbi:hypothetical protein D3C86_1525110 [compost metagenome]
MRRRCGVISPRRPCTAMSRARVFAAKAMNTGSTPSGRMANAPTSRLPTPSAWSPCSSICWNCRAGACRPWAPPGMSRSRPGSISTPRKGSTIAIRCTGVARNRTPTSCVSNAIPLASSVASTARPGSFPATGKRWAWAARVVTARPPITWPGPLSPNASICATAAWWSTSAMAATAAKSRPAHAVTAGVRR